MTSKVKSYLLCHTKVCVCVCVCVCVLKTYVTMPYFVLFYFISFDLISFPFRGILGKGLGTDETQPLGAVHNLRGGLSSD